MAMVPAVSAAERAEQGTFRWTTEAEPADAGKQNADPRRAAPLLVALHRVALDVARGAIERREIGSECVRRAIRTSSCFPSADTGEIRDATPRCPLSSLSRRVLLVGLVIVALPPLASALPAVRAPVDPLASLTPPPPAPLAERLRAFADRVAEHRWDELRPYFDPEHLAFQHKIWFSPEYNKRPDNPDDPKAQAAFYEWYLIEVLGLGMVDNHVKKLDHVESIRYLTIEEPFGEEGPLRVQMEVSARRGRVLSGWFFVDRATWLFFGSSG